MSHYRDINKLDDEGLLLEQYTYILRYLHDLINTNDKLVVNCLKFNIDNSFKFMIKLKNRILERKDI